MYFYRDYVSVAQRQKKAEKLVAKLRKQGQRIAPVDAFKGKMATTFWGKSWCDALESYADYENRLGRGRSYARSGCVCHLDIRHGEVEALVSGSDLYTLTVRIQPLAPERWQAVCARCSGQIGSLMELLQGKISQQVMAIVCDPATGLFPLPKEITFDCSCPDWASMCKHVAAVLYGIARRLDTEPDLLFVLRGVNGADLIPSSLDFSQGAQPDTLQSDDLGALFGIDLDEGTQAPAPVDTKAHKRQKPSPNAKPAPAVKPPFKPNRPTGSAIRKLRKLAGLSPAAFAETLGVCQATLHRWEERKGVLTLRAPSRDALSAFQEKLLRELSS